MPFQRVKTSHFFGVVVLGSVSALTLRADLQIHDGDRVVFLGDSITEQRLYTTYIEGYVLSRHPDWKLTFRNVGWGGDTAWLRQRAHPDEGKLFAAEGETLDKMVVDSVKRGLERDVLPLHPTFITIKFGMNDHSYQAFRPDIFRAYARSQTELATVLEGAGARVAFLTPQPIEERRADPDKDDRNISLRKFSDGLKEVAAAKSASFVDQFDPYMAVMMAERAKNPQALIGGGDAVHPGPIGHTVMAWAVLKGLGATADVSSAEIDAATGAGKGTGCKIDHVNAAGGTVSFDRTDDALPLPVDERATQALKLAPILDDLSRYTLRVAGLAAGDYDVTIDGQAAGRVSSDTLAAGWNLTVSAGPVTAQARELLGQVFEKNNLYFHRWREVQLYGFPSWVGDAAPAVEAKRKEELSRIDAQIAERESRINLLRKPKSHHFEIKPHAP
jgi:lysophospholipase L1-like esterase